jgi:hypothetical protein
MNLSQEKCSSLKVWVMQKYFHAKKHEERKDAMPKKQEQKKTKKRREKENNKGSPYYQKIEKQKRET